jgi:hypothetical protein
VQSPAALAGLEWVRIRAKVSIPAVVNVHTDTKIQVSAPVESLFRSRRSGRRGGISSPEVSLLKKCRKDASAGADLASSSAIRVSARCSRAFRLRGASVVPEKAVVAKPDNETTPAGEG